MAPPPSPQSITLELANQADTARLAARLAEHLARCLGADANCLQRLRIDLHGDLGAGKTTFVRHLLRSLGVAGRIKSPTYALLEPYELDALELQVFHFDLYRLESPDEWLESGLQDTMHGPGLSLVEWPQKAGELLGLPDLSLYFDFVPGHSDRRHARLLARTEPGATLLQSVLKSPL